MTTTHTVEVITTVRIKGESKTFTATAETNGDPTTAARNLVNTTAEDARSWTHEMERNFR